MITIITTIYNEENRLPNFIKTFIWCDDLIIIDKSSSDESGKIVSTSNAKHIVVDYNTSTKDQLERAILIAKHDWILIITASDLVDYSLILKIKELLNEIEPHFNCIALPYKRYVFGNSLKASPWYQYKFSEISLIKKSNLKISNRIHKEINVENKNVFKYKNLERFGYVHHLTHQNIETFFERTIRYSKIDAEQELLEEQTKSPLTAFFIILIKLIIRKNFRLLTRKGAFLFFSYLLYPQMKMVILLENQYNVHNKQYDEILNKIFRDYDSNREVIKFEK